MTELMWFVYLANVLPSFAMGLALALGISSFVTVFLWFIWTASYSDSYSSVERPAPSRLLWVAILSAFLAVCTNLVPDKDTLYLMAAAKGAEVAVTSETGQEILSDIQEVIQFQLQSLKEKPLTSK